MSETKPSDKVKRIKKKQPKHVVVFQNEDGTVIKTSFVAHGQAATPPEPPVTRKKEKHYKLVFEGWDQDYTRVTSNLVVKPLWRKEPKNYLVMYFHENGSMLGMESVPYGSPAGQAYLPEKESDEEYDYPFLGWNCDLSHIEGDTNAKAVFGKVRKIFTVRFYHEDGTLLKEEKVHYDESAHPPADVRKEADPVYHYQFAGWSYPTDHIKSSLNIHAVFEYIYNEYTVTFYEEDKILSSQKLHYEDEIIYPGLYKKGYDLLWDRQIKIVTGDQKIHGCWSFSNPVNKVINTLKGEFKITNPSIHNGTVCCLKYHSGGTKKVELPSEVRIGEYFYRITEIGPYAFKDCVNMEVLVLPDCLNKICDRGVAGCRRLREVILGKGISSLGKGIFADDIKLKKIIFTGKGEKLLRKEVLERAPRRLQVKAKDEIRIS